MTVHGRTESGMVGFTSLRPASAGFAAGAADGPFVPRHMSKKAAYRSVSPLRRHFRRFYLRKPVKGIGLKAAAILSGSIYSHVVT
ncbi:hypothetical protein KCP73_15910 [Salmonella enterica subsp. enterica]|nr:hypothetical protein KCP73_15910 [Salmonella enterica subsp. enterica]